MVKSVSHKLLSEISELPHHVMIVEFFKSVKLAASNRDRLDRNEDDFGCSEPPTEKALKFLDKICEDCYHMYKDSDVYDMCRTDCFSSGYFNGCMNVMRMVKSERSRAALL